MQDIQVGPSIQDRVLDYITNWSFVWKYCLLLVVIFGFGILLAFFFSPIVEDYKVKCCEHVCEVLNCSGCNYTSKH